MLSRKGEAHFELILTLFVHPLYAYGQPQSRLEEPARTGGRWDINSGASTHSCSILVASCYSQTSLALASNWAHKIPIVCWCPSLLVSVDQVLGQRHPQRGTYTLMYGLCMVQQNSVCALVFAQSAFFILQLGQRHEQEMAWV